MQRRLLLTLPAALLNGAGRPIGTALQAAVGPKGVPGMVAAVATSNERTFQGAYGNVTMDTVFRIHSMTKPVTSVAAMQLVEKGELRLDDPIEKYLPELAKLKILTGFDANKKPLLTPARRQPTIRQLLSHTAGFGYTSWDANLAQYGGGEPPLLFEPGTKWQYGTNVDVIGKVVERLSKQTLEQYFQANIFAPLNMRETTFTPNQALQQRLAPRGVRQPDGTWKEEKVPMPAKITPNGGGGLVSTAADYVKFMQMFLKGNKTVLKPESIAAMRKNQIGALSIRKMVSTNQTLTRDFGFHLEAHDKFGLGFQINETPYKGGRAAGSLAWAGFWNTFFWIDPKSNLCAVMLMQTAPFFDELSIAALQAFEHAVYQ
jgi:CubicO group peptidase (beta-lactamase class C family)